MIGKKLTIRYIYKMIVMPSTLKGKKGDRYIKNDDLILVGKHAKPKWELVKNAIHIFCK